MHRRVMALLVCVLLLLGGCEVAEPLTPESEVAVPKDAVYNSLEALSEGMGYTVISLFTLPMGYREVEYACRDGAAVIGYRHSGSGDVIAFYMVDTDTEFTLPDGDYETVFTHLRDGVEIPALGIGELVFLADWRVGDYRYRIVSETGIDPAIFRMMLEDIA